MAKQAPLLIGVGMPHMLYLQQFGKLVHDAFGEFPYLVGSATTTKQWRDVDVRLILPDDQYERLIGTVERADASNHRWVAFCMAFAELGKRITGLPIDFQIQQHTLANLEYPKQYRCPLILASDIRPADSAEGEAT